MKKLIYTLTLIFALTACSNDTDDANAEIEKLSKTYPQCVVDKIKTIYQGEFYGPTTVKKYRYNNQIVYNFDHTYGDSSSGAGSFSILN